MVETRGEDEQSLGQLVAAVSRDMSTLVRAEIELAKAEVREEAKVAAASGAMFGAAGFVAALALVLLSFAAAYGIVALGLDPGWAFLIVGGAYLLLAGLFGLVGALGAKRIRPPARTIRTVKQTVAFARHPRAQGDGHGPGQETGQTTGAGSA